MMMLKQKLFRERETWSAQGGFSTRTAQATPAASCSGAVRSAEPGPGGPAALGRGAPRGPRAAPGSAGRQSFPNMEAGTRGWAVQSPVPPAAPGPRVPFLPRGGHFCTGRIPAVPLPSPTTPAPRCVVRLRVDPSTGGGGENCNERAEGGGAVGSAAPGPFGMGSPQARRGGGGRSAPLQLREGLHWTICAWGGGEVACSPPPPAPPPLSGETGGPGGRAAARIFGGGGERSPPAPVCRERGPRCRLGIGGSVLGKGETAAPSPRGRAGWGPACWLWLLLHWRMRGGRGAGSGGAGGSPSGWRGGLYE